jgi:hypothetical protein
MQFGLACAPLDGGPVRELCETPSYLKKGFFLRNTLGLFGKLEASLDEPLVIVGVRQSEALRQPAP